MGKYQTHTDINTPQTDRQTGRHTHALNTHKHTHTHPHTQCMYTHIHTHTHTGIALPGAHCHIFIMILMNFLHLFCRICKNTNLDKRFNCKTVEKCSFP